MSKDELNRLADRWYPRRDIIDKKFEVVLLFIDQERIKGNAALIGEYGLAAYET
jgi:hypothetical protein